MSSSCCLDADTLAVATAYSSAAVALAAKTPCSSPRSFAMATSVAPSSLRALATRSRFRVSFSCCLISEAVAMESCTYLAAASMLASPFNLAATAASCWARVRPPVAPTLSMMDLVDAVIAAVCCCTGFRVASMASLKALCRAAAASTSSRNIAMRSDAVPSPGPRRARALPTRPIVSMNPFNAPTTMPTAAVSSFRAAVMMLMPPASPAFCAARVKAFFRRSHSGTRPSVSPCSSRSPAVNAGKKSRAARLPDSTSFTSSASVMPRPLAVRLNAPGRESPNCWRSSSMLTTPFEAICPSASSASDVRSAPRPSEPAARVSEANSSLLCCTGTLADFMEAENLMNESLSPPTLTPPSRAALRRNSNWLAVVVVSLYTAFNARRNVSSWTMEAMNCRPMSLTFSTMAPMASATRLPAAI